MSLQSPTVPAPTQAITSQPTQPTYFGLSSDLTNNGVLVFGVWLLLFIIVTSFAGFLLKVAGFRLKWPSRLKKVTGPGGISIEIEPEKVSTNPEANANDTQEFLIEAKASLEAEKVEFRAMLKRMMKEAFVFMHDILKEETKELDHIQEEARGYTRQHVEDFIAQITEMNHRIYQVKTGHPIPMGGDRHFNTICDGKLQVILPRLLLNIYDRNHMREMSETEYRDTMRKNYEYIKRQVFATLAKDWYHLDYTFEDFMRGLEEHGDRGIDGFMWLMDKYRGLSDAKRAALSRTQDRIGMAVDHIEDHGEIPLKDI